MDSIYKGIYWDPMLKKESVYITKCYKYKLRAMLLESPHSSATAVNKRNNLVDR